MERVFGPTVKGSEANMAGGTNGAYTKAQCSV